MKPMFFTRDWPAYYQRNGKNRMQQYLTGQDVDFPFACYDLPYSVSGEHGHHKVITSEVLLWL